MKTDASTHDHLPPAEGPAPSLMTLEEARRRWGYDARGRGGPSVLSEDQWLCVMIEWWAGATDSELGRRWGLGVTTIARQRVKRGLLDGDRPQRGAPPRAWDEVLSPPPKPAPEPEVSPGALARAARAEARAAAAEAEAWDDAGAGSEPLPPAPTLRASQRPPTEEGWRTWLFLGGRGAGRRWPGRPGWRRGRRRAGGWRWWGRRCWTCGR